MPRTELVGGPGGAAFDDIQELGNLGKIQEIKIRSGDWVNAISIVYKGEQSQSDAVSHGGGGGAEHRFRLGPDEYIHRVIISSGAWLNSIQFFTTKDDRKSPVFGIFRDDVTVTDITFPPEGKGLLSSIFGRSGEYLDAIGFEYEEDPVDSVVLSDLTFAKGTFDSNATKPDTLANLFATNSSDQDQTSEVDLTSQTTDKVTFSSSFGFKEGLGFTFGSEGLISSEISINFEATQSFGFGKETTLTNSITAKMPIKVPANSQMHGTLQVARQKCSADYTATATITHKSGAVTTEQIDGTFDGIVSTTVQTVWDKAQPLDGKVPVGAKHISLG